MKIALAGFLLVVVALVAAWYTFVSAPAPEQVCRHIMAITLAEADEQAMAADTRNALLERLELQCIQHKKDKIALRGRIAYARYARCVVDAKTLRAIEDC